MKLYRVVVDRRAGPDGKFSVYGPAVAEAVDVSGKLYAETSWGLEAADRWHETAAAAQLEAAAELERIGEAAREQAGQLRKEAAT